MAQPTWITAAGDLGTIPEGLFYQTEVVASVPPDPIPVTCTATQSGTNLITCDDITPLEVGKVIKFTGVPFGTLEINTTYFIYAILSNTQFQIKDHPDSTSALTMTDATGSLIGTVSTCVFYRLQAGVTPEGIQVDVTGTCYGVPQPVTLVQGVPVEVGQDVTSKFTMRAYTTINNNSSGAIDRFIDRTFSLTVTGNDPPTWLTPAGSIGTYYDSDRVDIQLQYSEPDPDDVVTVRLVQGDLPLGLKLNSQGRITGYIRPYPNEDDPVGYDLQPYMTAPYDFVTSSISKNYQFTLEITDGKTRDLRTFSIYVYNRDELTGDNTVFTADDAFLTADETTVRAPFLINYDPSDIGTVRGGNNFAYRFIGQNYDYDEIEYVFSVNEGYGTPPGLTLDPYSGWYYGAVPDVGVTETTYSFNIQVRARSLVISATTSGTNAITCDSNTRGDFFVGAQVTFEGAVIGGLAEDTTYYVTQILSDTQFTVSLSQGGPNETLTTATTTGLLRCVPQFIPSSELYPFTLTVTGAIDREVTWITPSNLGDVVNGSISLLKVEAESRNGTPLLYQLKSGAYNSLPQGLDLLPNGEIVGRVSFQTFSLDQGSTTVDTTSSNLYRRDDTTFDSTHTFTVNAYAQQDQVPLYEVNSVRVLDGGTGFVTAPSLTFSTPIGAAAVQAQADVTVDGSAIVDVTVTNSGADYTGIATYSLTGPGTGANLQVIMQQTGYNRIINVFKTFSVRVIRVFNKPYQNLSIMAMPPQNDRVILNNLLTDTNIFVPDYIFRPLDPNFGLSQQVSYQHAFGLDPETLDTYVESLNLNHYRKNLVLGQVQTAQALDVDGNVIYEVVYSRIVDDLVNDAGQSVSKIVTTPYAINNPEPPPTLINNVYPNSLVNMRDQVIDVVGQVVNSLTLPIWMTSKQTNGQVLGFTPAWVICYTKPQRSAQIAYYLNKYFGPNLNQIDFQVDRYVLDTTLSVNWDPAEQNWEPQPLQTTFDRIDVAGYTDIGVVNACTELAFDQVQARTINEINALGGLDGQTWIAIPNQTAPVGTKVTIRNGSRVIFVKQENFGSGITEDQAFSNNYVGRYDSGEFDLGISDTTIGSFDYGTVITGGYTSFCTASDSGTDLITCASTINMQVNDRIWFTGDAFGGISVKNSQSQVQVYYVQSIDSITGSTTNSATDYITVDSVADLNLGDEVWFPSPAVVSITEVSSLTNTVTVGSISDIVVNMKFTVLQGIGNLATSTTYYVKTLEGSNKVTLSATVGGATIDPGTAAGLSTCLVGGTIGGIDAVYDNGLARPYYISDIVGSQIGIANTVGGTKISLTTDSGSCIIRRAAFSVSLEPNAIQPLSLSTDTGSMTVNYENRRMAIYTVQITGNNDTVALVMEQETVADDYVTSSQGQKYATGTYLYHPQSAQQSLNRVNWQPLITTTATVTDETTFDYGSVQWVEPVDMYNPTDRNDKYLVFPKVDILQ